MIVAIGTNSSKQRYLPVEQMLALISERICRTSPAYRCAPFRASRPSLPAKSGARFLLRGLRNSPDFEYEKPIAFGNQHVNPGLETVFLLTSPALAAISSTIIRDIHRFGGNVDAFVPFALPPAAANSPPAVAQPGGQPAAQEAG